MISMDNRKNTKVSFSIGDSSFSLNDGESANIEIQNGVWKFVNYDKKKEVPKMDISLETIYVDGGQNVQTGDEAWGCVVTVDKIGKKIDLIEIYKDLFADMKLREVTLPVGKRTVIVSKFSDVATQQNNGAELLAMVAGLRIAKATGKQVGKICSDSELIEKWWSKGHVSASKKKEMDPRKYAYIEECAKLRKELEKNDGIIKKISGKGNPADLGYH